MATSGVLAGAGRADERGSVAMASLLLVFASLLAAVVVQVGLGGLRDSVADTDRSAASGAAELGLAEAVTRIDQGATASFRGTISVHRAEVSYEATEVGDDAWEVYSEGRSGRSTQARTVAVGREGRFPFALFAASGFSLTNNSGSLTGRFGSNGEVRISGRGPSEPVMLYRPTGSCSGCASTVRVDGPRPSPDPVVPDTTRPCPDSGLFTGQIDGANGVAILCDDPLVPVSFSSTVSVVNGPLAVHVLGDVPITMDGASVNAGGAAEDVLLLVHRPPLAASASLSMEGASFTGLLYAPGRNLTVTELRSSGSLVVQRFDQSGSGRIDMAYDSGLAAIESAPWGVFDWRAVTPR